MTCSLNKNEWQIQKQILNQSLEDSKGYNFFENDELPTCHRISVLSKNTENKNINIISQPFIISYEKTKERPRIKDHMVSLSYIK